MNTDGTWGRLRVLCCAAAAVCGLLKAGLVMIGLSENAGSCNGGFERGCGEVPGVAGCKKRCSSGSGAGTDDMKPALPNGPIAGRFEGLM